MLGETTTVTQICRWDNKIDKICKAEIMKAGFLMLCDRKNLVSMIERTRRLKEKKKIHITSIEKCEYVWMTSAKLPYQYIIISFTSLASIRSRLHVDKGPISVVQDYQDALDAHRRSKLLSG